MYNNIVIYIVGHGQEDNMSPNEMHIFQCVNVSARDVVEDLKAFKQGRYRLVKYWFMQGVPKSLEKVGSWDTLYKY